MHLRQEAGGEFSRLFVFKKKPALRFCQRATLPIAHLVKAQKKAVFSWCDYKQFRTRKRLKLFSKYEKQFHGFSKPRVVVS